MNVALAMIASLAGCGWFPTDRRPPPTVPAPQPASAPTPLPMVAVAKPEPHCEQSCDAGPGVCSKRAFAQMNSNDADEQACARRWLEQACEDGHMGACNGFGYMLQLGKGGRDDRARAIALYQRACDAHVLPGCINYASTLEHEDGAHAEAIYERVCDDGGSDGCWLAADMLAAGRDVPKDVKRALALYDRGCEKKNAMACDKMQRVKP